MNKKFLKKKKAGKDKNAYDCVLEELQVLKRLDHPTILWLHEIINDPQKDHIYLVTAFQSKGSVQPGGDMRPYFTDMLKALFYCHKVVNVIHRDIKPDNIMLNHNDEAVLIDFGVSALVDNKEDLYFDSNMGSYMFFSAEMFNIS